MLSSRTLQKSSDALELPGGSCTFLDDGAETSETNARITEDHVPRNLFLFKIRYFVCFSDVATRTAFTSERLGQCSVLQGPGTIPEQGNIHSAKDQAVR